MEQPLLWVELREPVPGRAGDQLHRLNEEAHGPFLVGDGPWVYYTQDGHVLAVPLHVVRRVCLAPVEIDAEGTDL